MRKKYFQPEVTVAQVALNSIILAGSAGESFSISNTESSEVW